MGEDKNEKNTRLNLLSRLDVGALDSGVYFYEIFNAGGTVTKGKFVRE